MIGGYPSSAASGVIGGIADKENVAQQLMSTSSPAEVDSRWKRWDQSNVPAALAGPRKRPWHAWEIWCTGYLRDYGYAPSGMSVWKENPEKSGPVFSMSVTGHEQVDGNTHYTIECAIEGPLVHDSGKLAWKAMKRLCTLRDKFHDKIKVEIGEGGYQKAFLDTPFASRGGIPGTTARLHAWCTQMSACINKGIFPPSLVAVLLQALGAPKPFKPAHGYPKAPATSAQGYPQAPDAPIAPDTAASSADPPPAPPTLEEPPRHQNDKMKAKLTEDDKMEANLTEEPKETALGACEERAAASGAAAGAEAHELLDKLASDLQNGSLPGDVKIDSEGKDEEF